MPLADQVFLLTVVVAFSIFAGALAWADWQTSGIRPK